MASQPKQQAQTVAAELSDSEGIPQTVTFKEVCDIAGKPPRPKALITADEKENVRTELKRRAVLPPAAVDLSAAVAGVPTGDMVPANVLASELNVPVDEVIAASGHPASHFLDRDEPVDRQIVMKNLGGAAATAADPADSGTTAINIDDTSIRQQLASLRPTDYTKEDKESLRWMWSALVKWFKLQGAAVKWRTEPEEFQKRVEGVWETWYRYPSPVVPGFTIELPASQYTQLKLDEAKMFPIINEDVLLEFVHRVSGLSVIPHVCKVCNVQLQQSIRNKVEKLLAGELALPQYGGATRTMLRAEGFDVMKLGLVSRPGGRARELRFHDDHIECHEFGPRIDELVKTMLQEGADFNQEGWVQDFVERALKLTGQVLVELKPRFNWITREKLEQRLVDILDNYTPEVAA